MREFKEVDEFLVEAIEALSAARKNAPRDTRKAGVKTSPYWGLKSARAARIQLAGIAKKLAAFEPK